MVDWSKYKKGIPYNVVQGSGDENALGILKFNFPNKYAVYLHDTNQRYLFSQDYAVTEPWMCKGAGMGKTGL